jgi:4-alpha-glucanotransferase
VALAEALLNRRRAGVCLHLTSLPGPRGIGELGGQALAFLDWMQAHELTVWQFLPTGPTGYGNSPYQPLSVFAGNPLMVDLAALVEWGLLRPDEIVAPDGFDERQVDYDRVADFKRPLLSLAANRFLELRDSQLSSEFETFRADNDAVWLDDFAAFARLRTSHANAAWPNWSAANAADRQAQVASLKLREADDLNRTRVIQFFFKRQWRALRFEAVRRNILLFGDVPIYMALDCSEAWARPELLELNDALWPAEVAGVPPDYFSAEGQLWGNPVYRWDAHGADGFRWWIARLRHALDDVDIVRLDHFRAFDEFWAVPYGAATAREGRWRPGPGGALFDALRAALGSAPFVAEDLGLITESVTALRKAYALPGMQVLQFLVDKADFDVASIEEDCICYTGTHDNDTTVGWFLANGTGNGAAGQAWQQTVARNVELTGQSINKALILLSFKSAARIAAAPLQDYLGLDSAARLNTPGQALGNWRWRATEAQLDGREADLIGGWVTEANRS